MNNEDLRELCLSLPATEEEISGEMTFVSWWPKRCIAWPARSGQLVYPSSATMKILKMLLERESIVPAPDLARNKWITVENPGALSRAEWINFITKSYALIVAKLTKKIKGELGLKE